MAGSLYLGSQMVCPVIVTGGSPEPEPTEYFTLKFPDGDTYGNKEIQIMLTFLNESGTALRPVVIDFNKIKEFKGNLAPSQYNWEYVPVIAKVENIQKLSENGLNHAFNGCLAAEGYKDINFENLEEVGSSCLASAFYNEEEKTFNNAYFPKLTKIDINGFSVFGNTGINIYFNSLTPSSFLDSKSLNQIGYGNNKTLHFPSNLSSVIPTLYGYPNFGGTNTTILYDLPATE